MGGFPVSLATVPGPPCKVGLLLVALRLPDHRQIVLEFQLIRLLHPLYFMYPLQD